MQLQLYNPSYHYIMHNRIGIVVALHIVMHATTNRISNTFMLNPASCAMCQQSPKLTTIGILHIIKNKRTQFCLLESSPDFDPIALVIATALDLVLDLC